MLFRSYGQPIVCTCMTLMADVHGANRQCGNRVTRTRMTSTLVSVAADFSNNAIVFNLVAADHDDPPAHKRQRLWRKKQAKSFLYLNFIFYLFSQLNKARAFGSISRYTYLVCEEIAEIIQKITKLNYSQISKLGSLKPVMDF